MTSLNFKNCHLIKFPKIGDSKRGYLTFFESNKGIPFEIKRVYYIYNIEDNSQIRGPHAHKETEQVFINVQGHATYYLDDGKNKSEIILNEPNLGIYIGPEIWHHMGDFSEDIIFLVVSSSNYDESDYIRSYKEFITYGNSNNLV